MTAARVAVEGFFAEPGEEARDRLVMARSAGLLYIAGGLLGVASLALPHAAGAKTGGIAAVCVISVVLGLFVMFERGRLPRWAFPASCFIASLLICGAIKFSHLPDSPYAIYFVLVAMFVAYFLSVYQLLVQTAFIALGYYVTASSLGSTGEFAQDWMLTVWSVIVIGAFIAILRQRMNALISRLSDAASSDPLTHLLNRRGFRDIFDLELERSRRSGRPCALLMGDLDHFKRVNDMLGHPAGDERLRAFARLLDSGKRRIDAAARMGGEEFALLLPETDEHGAYVIAERLRHAVREAFAADQIALTVSFGVAAYPNHGASGDQLLQAADQALYVAKELGRDRTAIYRAEVTAQMLSAKDRSAFRAEGYLSAMLVLAEAVDLRDGGPVTHSETVGRYAELMAAELGLDEERVQRVKLAGVLHDIGKVAVPDEVLQKAGPLDSDELEEIQKHCELGSRLLSGAGLEDIAAWVLSSHERPDGKGYPAGLSGKEIPPEARILAVADAYEAMVADRVYRMGIGAERARLELEKGAGTQFDPLVVEAFLNVLERADRALGVR